MDKKNRSRWYIDSCLYRDEKETDMIIKDVQGLLKLIEKSCRDPVSVEIMDINGPDQIPSSLFTGNG